MTQTGIGLATSQEPGSKKVLVDMIITSDQKTTGFLEDSQIVIQIALEQFFLTLKILFKKGLYVTTHTAHLGDIRDLDGKTKSAAPKEKRFFRKIAQIIKNSLIAFFSFTLHRMFQNIPQLPR